MPWLHRSRGFFSERFNLTVQVSTHFTMRNSIFATVVAMTGCVLAAAAHSAPAQAFGMGNSYYELRDACLRTTGNMTLCHSYARCMRRWQVFPGDLTFDQMCTQSAVSYVNYGMELY